MLRLYVSPGCEFCDKVKDFLKNREILHEIVDVSTTKGGVSAVEDGVCSRKDEKFSCFTPALKKDDGTVLKGFNEGAMAEILDGSL